MSEKKQPTIINVDGTNVAITPIGYVLNGKDGHYAQVTIEMDFPELMLNKGRGLQGKLAVGPESWPKRRELMGKVNKYIQERLGDKYEFGYSNHGMYIELKNKQPEYDEHKAREPHKTHNPVIDGLFLGNPFEIAGKGIMDDVGRALKTAKMDPKLLGGKIVPKDVIETGKKALFDSLGERYMWQTEGGEVNSGGTTYWIGYHAHSLIFPKGGDNPDTIIDGIHAFAERHNLEIGARNAGRVIYVEASPVARDLLLEMIAREKPVEGKPAGKPEIMVGAGLPKTKEVVD